MHLIVNVRRILSCWIGVGLALSFKVLLGLGNGVVGTFSAIVVAFGIVSREKIGFGALSGHVLVLLSLVRDGGICRIPKVDLIPWFALTLIRA